MKKLLFALTLLCTCSIAAHAQFSSIIFNNNTTCTVYVELVGTTSGSGCNTNYATSTYVAIPPGNTTFNDPSMVTPSLDDGFGNTLGSTDHFTLIKVGSSNPTGTTSCAAFSSFVMSDCAGWPAVTNITGFTIDNSTTCSACTIADFTLNVAGGIATVDIM